VASGFDNDPHSQDGQPCPRNCFGITVYAELTELEDFFVTKRAAQLEARGLPGTFDLPHLCTIHRYLFQDVFPWAGELRRVGLSKAGGAPFAAPMHITSALTEAFTALRKENLLHDLDRLTFCQRAAFYLGEINAVHPFREGNGRTQREFIRQLAANAGYTLSWAGISPADNLAASIASHTRGDNSGLAAMLAAAIIETG